METAALESAGVLICLAQRIQSYFPATDRDLPSLEVKANGCPISRHIAFHGQTDFLKAEYQALWLKSNCAGRRVEVIF